MNQKISIILLLSILLLSCNNAVIDSEPVNLENIIEKASKYGSKFINENPETESFFVEYNNNDFTIISSAENALNRLDIFENSGSKDLKPIESHKWVYWKRVSYQGYYWNMYYCENCYALYYEKLYPSNKSISENNTTEIGLYLDAIDDFFQNTPNISEFLPDNYAILIKHTNNADELLPGEESGTTIEFVAPTINNTNSKAPSNTCSGTNISHHWVYLSTRPYTLKLPDGSIVIRLYNIFYCKYCGDMYMIP